MARKIDDSPRMRDIGDPNLPSAFQHDKDILARKTLIRDRKSTRNYDERRVPPGRVYQVISETGIEPEVGHVYPAGNSLITYNPKTKLWEYATSLAVQQPIATTIRLVKNNPYKN